MWDNQTKGSRYETKVHSRFVDELRPRLMRWSDGCAELNPKVAGSTNVNRALFFSTMLTSFIFLALPPFFARVFTWRNNFCTFAYFSPRESLHTLCNIARVDPVEAMFGRFLWQVVGI